MGGRGLNPGDFIIGSKENAYSSCNKFSVEILQKQVSKQLPFDKLATLLSTNPKQAQNELKAVCKQVLSDEYWEELSYLEKDNLTNELIDVIVGFGPVESLIANEQVTEVMVNGSKSIFYEIDGQLQECDAKFSSDDQVRVLIDRIIGPLGRRIDESSPMVDARLPQGHRVNAIIPPIALDGPCITIRSFTRKVMTLDEMNQVKSLDKSVANFLKWAVRTRKSIVVSGGTGSGKTTLLNALSLCLPKDERIITIEDSAELRFLEHKHVVRLEARPKNTEGSGEITIRDLVKNALRMRPDRIVVGEVRAAEALDMLQAMSTGHDGSLTTVHSNSTKDVIERIVTLVRYGMDLPVSVIESQIASAFDLIVQLQRAPNGSRYLSEISEVFFDKESERCFVKNIYKRCEFDSLGSWLEQPSSIDDINLDEFQELI